MGKKIIKLESLLKNEDIEDVCNAVMDEKFKNKSSSFLYRILSSKNKDTIGLYLKQAQERKYISNIDLEIIRLAMDYHHLKYDYMPDDPLHVQEKKQEREIEPKSVSIEEEKIKEKSIDFLFEHEIREEKEVPRFDS